MREESLKRILKRQGFREYKIIKNDGEVFRVWSTTDLRTGKAVWELSEEKDEKQEAMKKLVIEIKRTLSDMDFEESDVELLQTAMKFFCSKWDICEGHKSVIIEALRHWSRGGFTEEKMDNFQKLLDMLKGIEN